MASHKNRVVRHPKRLPLTQHQSPRLQWVNADAPKMPSDRLPTGDEKRAAVRAMFDGVAPRYDLLNRLLTFRMDVGWRKRAMRSLKLGDAAVVADLASGTGDFCQALEDAGHTAIGVDLSFGMLANARNAGPNVQGDLLDLPLKDQSVDAAVCGFALRNLVALEPFLAEVARIVRPGGRIALLDVAVPPNPVLRAGYNVYFGKVVPVVGGLISDRTAYGYLPRSVSYLPPAEEMVKMIDSAGFDDAQHVFLSGGISQLLTAKRAV